MLPFVALFPGVIWLGVSADGLFAGVTATGIALLALSRRRPPLALLAGVVLGFGIFLSYGLVLIGLIALAVVRSWRALGLALVGALAVVVVFALAGFWWLDGYHLVVERYYQGIASERPYGYWVWANLACLAIATGPALVAGVRRTVAGRWSDPVVLLGLAALLVVAFADLSGLSKAETERIWLPFAVWLLPAAALLPAPGRRGWLVAQAATALVVNHLVFTYW